MLYVLTLLFTTNSLELNNEYIQINQQIAKRFCKMYDNFTIECVDLYQYDFSLIELPLFAKSLELVIFTGNRLNQIEESIFKTNVSIQLLNLSSNKIKSICSRAFSNMKRLGYLNLDYNYLNIESNFDFLRPISETLIGLSLTSAFNKSQSSSSIYNQIIRIFSQSELINLKNLSLSDNKLEMIDLEFVLSRLKKLKVLSLNINLFEYIAFDSNKCNSSSLQGLDLRYNNITTVNKEFIRSIENLRALNKSFRVALSHNPFKCDCDLLDFHTFLTSLNGKMVIDSNSITCAHPNSIKSTYNRPVANSKLDSVCKTQIKRF